MITLYQPSTAAHISSLSFLLAYFSWHPPPALLTTLYQLITNDTLPTHYQRRFTNSLSTTLYQLIINDALPTHYQRLFTNSLSTTLYQLIINDALPTHYQRLFTNSLSTTLYQLIINDALPNHYQRRFTNSLSTTLYQLYWLCFTNQLIFWIHTPQFIIIDRQVYYYIDGILSATTVSTTRL